tara:strand:+ start:166 stop:306 length:141 start_codon:yes stop_codon:yes gene_type:complete
LTDEEGADEEGGNEVGASGAEVEEDDGMEGETGKVVSADVEGEGDD